jgi:Ca-activated chloride channel homolog
MKTESIEYCTRCQTKIENDLLPEIAYGKERYLFDLVKKAQKYPDSALSREAFKQMTQRLTDFPAGAENNESEDGGFQSQEWQEGLISRGSPKPEDISVEDIKSALEEYKDNGLISFQKEKVVITPKGVKKLAAKALERIFNNLRHRSQGLNPVEKIDFGGELSPGTRRYEIGDDYSTVDPERTALNAIYRCGQLKFEPEDFEVHEEIRRSKLHAGILIDESGSMRDSHKLEAAMETALALSKLITSQPDNSLKIFVFSDEVKQIDHLSIVSKIIIGGDTDISGALAAFRRAVRHEYGDKQAFLITDTKPNHEEGRHLPFDKAATGLLAEASRYRQEKIGLNIVMLDEAPELKSLAMTLAKQNLGRVFFTSPSNLGEVLVEDYFRGRRRALNI